MKVTFRTATLLFSVAVLFFTVALVPWMMRSASAATSTLTVDGNQHFQTIDGFGVNANSESWKNGQLKPAIDTLASGGSTIWRVIIDNADWEATNDNNDPNTYNWAYYNTVYSSPKFQDLWNTIAYLNSKGITSGIELNFMGPGPSWMGGSDLTPGMEDEWAEMVSSLVYYARNTAHVQFGMISPTNEEDLDGIEGMRQTPSQYGVSLSKLATKLDADGISDLRFVGPDTANSYTGVSSYMPAMMQHPDVMNKVDHLSFHNYSGDTSDAAGYIADSAYPNKNFWMSEFSRFTDGMTELGQGASALMVWEGYDSAYNHPLLRGEQYIAPNDAGNGPALLAYNSSTGVYTPRKEYYQFSQLYKYVPAGSVRIGATVSGTGLTTTYAFRDPATGRLTIVGNNTGSTSQTVGIALNNVGTTPSALSYFQTNSSSNMTQGADVPVSNGAATVTIPANTIFTLTGLSSNDNQPPTVPANLAATATSSTQANVSWDVSTDNVGVTGYVVKRNGVIVAQPTTSSYTDNGLTPNTSYTYTVAAKDAAGNVSADSAPASVTTPPAPPDTQPPTTPTNLTATAAGQTKANLTWTAATDNVGVTGYNIFRGGAQIATSTSTSYTDSTLSAGNTYSYTVQAYDAAGNISANSTPASVTIPLTTSIWPASAVPTTPNDGDNSAVELGLKFRSDVSGKVTAIRFYKSSQNTGTHVGHLWSSTGTQLASVTFTGETASGWQQANLSTPVSITPNTTYVVSYYAPVGHYAGDNNFFANQSVDNPPLHALKNGTDGNNGVYRYGTGGGFPSSSYLSSNYWVDVAFAQDSPPPADTTAPTTSVTAPTDGSSVSGTQTVTATASDNVGVTKVEWYLDGVLQSSKSTAPYSFSWDTRTAANGAHQIVTKAYDAAGNVGSSSPITTTVFNDSTPPTAPDSLAAVASSPTQVDLTWNASTDNVGVTGYVVKRNGTTIAQPVTPGYSDTAVVASTTYTYTVYAVDAAGNQSQAATASVTTPPPPPDTQPPTTPGSLASSNTTTSSTKLTWAASTDNVGVTGYQILRDGTPVATTAATTYTDSGLQPGTAYSYTVQAFDAAGNYSAASSPLNVTTVAVDTTAPQVSVTAPANGSVTSGTVNVTAAATDNVGVVGVQFKLDGANLGSEDTTSPYSASWDTTTASNGTHTLTAVARDAAGNTTTSSPITVTVNNTVATAITTDTIVSTHSTATVSSLVSPTFSTAGTNELLVAFVVADGPSSGGQTISTVTGGGLTWTLQKRTNTQAGTSEIWTAVATAQLTNAQVTATLAKTKYMGSITVVSLKNAQVGGATAGASASTGAPTVNLTTTQAGSQVWAVGNDWDGATARTLGTGQTMVDQDVASSVGDTFWVQRLTNPVTLPGTAVTVNDTAPTNHRWNLAAIEILLKP